MRTPRHHAVLASLLGVALATGCVKKSTYDAALDELSTTQGELAAMRSQAEQKSEQIEELEEQIESTRQDLARKQAQLRGLVEEGAATEEELDQLAASMEATQAELEELRRQRDAAEERIASYRELRDKLAALVDTGQLQVEFRDGQMVLQLPSAVLFPSGRATLRREGRESLQDVLDILLDFRDRQFMIAGHTDNVPIRGRFDDNWDLSTSRATSVVNYMVNAGFDPDSLVAAGFGEYAPVATNETDEGRAENRRIEIILLPDLSDLPTFGDGELAGGQDGESDGEGDGDGA